MKRIHMFSIVVVNAAIVLSACTASAEEPVDFQTTFEWSSQPTLTIHRAAMQESVTLSINIKHCPVRRLPAMLRVITEQGALDVAAVKVVRDSNEKKHAAITVALQPIERSATGEALKRLHKVLDLREIIIDASLSTDSNGQLIDLLTPANSRTAPNQLLNELKTAVEDALPNDISENEWVIELQGCHYFNEQAK